VEDVIAQQLNDIVRGIKQMIEMHQYLLNDDYSYPARRWDEKDVFAAFNGSALTDDPVYDSTHDLSIYLRGVLDGEYRIAQNILGNLERYADIEISDEWAETYKRRVESFWSDIVGKDLVSILRELGTDSVDEALKRIKEMKNESR